MTLSFRFSVEKLSHFVQDSLSRMEKFVPLGPPRHANRVDSATHRDSKYPVVETLADSERACNLLAQAIPEVRARNWRLISFQIKRVQRHHRKRIIMGLISYRQSKEPAPQTAEIVIKVYGSDRGSNALKTLRQLRQAGFCSPASYRVPRPYGYLAEEGALLQGVAPGTSWADLVRTDDLFMTVAASRSAEWLLQLQQSGLTGERKSPQGDAQLVQRWSQELATIFPEKANCLESASGRLSQALQIEGIPLVPSHGDYHPMNIFLTPTLTTVIDFDTFALRESAFDVGYAIGQLLIMSYLQTGAFGPGAEAALAFWRHYHKKGPAGWDRVAVQIARTLFQSLHYELYTLRNNRIELLDLWLDLIDAWLDSGHKTILDGLKVVRSSVQQVGV